MREDDGFRMVATGYQRSALVLNRVFNAVLACALILLGSPVFLFLSLLVWILQGRPIFYQGARLGLHKKPFTMFKFRTLQRNAESILGAELLTQGHRLVTPLGKFLRDTRLDELPQLFNIVLGDMDFVGPRPERPAVYEKICRHISGYDRRFEVKPALIGFSQLFTPHGTPKRIRTFIDNRLLRKKQIFLWDAYVVFWTGLVVLRTTLLKLGSILKHDFYYARILRRYREKRDFDRVAQEQAHVLWRSSPGDGEPDMRGRLVDINEEAFLLRSEQKLAQPPPGLFVLETEIGQRRGVTRRKQARCHATLFRESELPDGAGFEYVFHYSPVSPLHYYLVHQYFLKESIVDHE